MEKLAFLEKIEKHSPEKLVTLGKKLEYYTNQFGKACLEYTKECFSFEPSEEEQMLMIISGPGATLSLVSEAESTYKKIKGYITKNPKN